LKCTVGQTTSAAKVLVFAALFVADSHNPLGTGLFTLLPLVALPLHRIR